MLGVIRGDRITGSVAALPPIFEHLLDRFDAARPQLASAERAFLLFEPASRTTYGRRFFAAQYSLAPTVLSLAFRAEEVVQSPAPGESRLVLCTADDPQQLAAMLSALEAAARQQGWSFAAVPVDAELTVVRLGGS